MSAVVDRLLARCDQLASLSSLADGIQRVYLSDEHRAANVQVESWMREAGLDVRIDAVGNVIGRLGAPGKPTLLIGSHLDTVPYAGRYDGILGVLLGIELVGDLDQEPLPFAIEVIGFAEEEGVRFGTTLMTSRALAGTWDDAWLSLTDAQGISLQAAFDSFGLEIQSISSASRTGEPIVGFLEVHIEQGPVLESKDLPVAPVLSIAGARRFQLSVDGMAAHAGTMPMAMRRDALAAAAELVGLIEATANERDVLATVGQIEVEPGGVNVVPARAVLSLDIRAGADDARDSALNAILDSARALCERRGVNLDVEELHAARAAACDPALVRVLSDAVATRGIRCEPMNSGAGHDAMAMADLCPVGMLFVRSPGGISHHPDESILPEDVEVALKVLHTAVLNLAEKQ